MKIVNVKKPNNPRKVSISCMEQGMVYRVANGDADKSPILYIYTDKRELVSLAAGNSITTAQAAAVAWGWVEVSAEALYKGDL